MSGVSAERLRTQILTDSDAQELYQAYPEIKPSYEDFCPTCRQTGSYRWNDTEYECDCQLQLQLHKHYLKANIGTLYQRLDWDDLKDDGLRDLGQRYVSNHDNLVHQGTGLLFYGTFGAGKTMMATLILKDLVKLGYTCYSVTMAKMVDMFTSGWTSLDEKRAFDRKIKKSQILLLDDVGKEFRTKNALSEATFDSVLRERVQSSRPTFITTNETVEALGNGYGSSVLSLFRESSISHKFKGDDYRPTAGNNRMESANKGEVRPIV